MSKPYPLPSPIITAYVISRRSNGNLQSGQNINTETFKMVKRQNCKTVKR